MHDLVILVADKPMQFSLRGALDRPKSLGIRPIRADYVVHANRDGGVRKTGPDLLALKHSAAKHALMILDYEGCGANQPAAELEAELDQRLSQRWGVKAKAVVIEPELDVWMWGSDNALRSVLDWDKPASIREWLRNADWRFAHDDKPERPKEALEKVLRELRQPQSAALYEAIAKQISLARCQDKAFLRLKHQLQEWFPAV